MQAQYQRRPPVQLAVDLLEDGLHLQAHRITESQLSFSRIWELELLATIGICMFASVLAFAFLVMAGICQVVRVMQSGSNRGASCKGRGVPVSTAQKPKRA